MERPGHAQQPEEGLNLAPSVPTLQGMRVRVVLGLSLGVAGVCFGIAAAVLSIDALAITAGFCAVAGGLVLGGTSLTVLLGAKPPAAPSAAALPVGRSTPAPTPDASVIDPVTELPDARYFEVAVDGRVAAARRHLWPVSVVLLELGFDATTTEEHRNGALAKFSELMRQTLREADIACRLDERTFGLILEDTSEEGGVWTAERLQIALSHEATPIRRLVAGVAAYPTHGLFSKDVMVRARAALERASATPNGHGLGQVEVAHVDLS